MFNKVTYAKYLLLAFFCFPLLIANCSSPEEKFGIIFTANLNGNQDIYRTSSPDFQVIDQLTFTPIDREESLSLTKDGNRILFYVPGPSQERIASESLIPPATYAHTYILELSTKTTLELGDTYGFYLALPESWTVDENDVVLADSDSLKIYTVNPDEKIKKELIFPVSKGSRPVFINYSPDGKQIAFTENNSFSGKFTLVNYTPFIYDFKIDSLTQLGDGSTDCWNYQWSPAGKQILLFCNLAADGETVDPRIRLFNITTSENAVLAKEIGDFRCALSIAAWSPTGKQFVAYCRLKDNPISLVIFNSDGSIAKQISVEDSSRIYEVAWSPNGQKILYTAGNDENSLNIYLIDADGSNNHAITTQSSDYSELSVYSLEP